jgi:hypothetical protein
VKKLHFSFTLLEYLFAKFCTMAAASSNSIKALDIDSCRQDIEVAAVKKLFSGRKISIRLCLLDAGFCEDQASNKTMQARVRRAVQKLSRQAESQHEESVPLTITFAPQEEDDISVITGASGFSLPTTVTPRSLDVLPSAICIPGVVSNHLLVPVVVPTEAITRLLVPAVVPTEAITRISTLPFLTPSIPSVPFDAILPIARSRLNQNALGFPFEDAIAGTIPTRTMEWMPCPQPKKRRVASGVTCF